MINISNASILAGVPFATHCSPWMEWEDGTELGDDVSSIEVNMDEAGIGEDITFECGIDKDGSFYLHAVAYQIRQRTTIGVTHENVIRFDKPAKRFSDTVIKPRDQPK